MGIVKKRRQTLAKQKPRKCDPISTGNYITKCYDIMCLHHPICRQYETQSCVGIMDAINTQWIEGRDGMEKFNIMDKKQKDNLIDSVFRFKEVMDSRKNTLNSFCKYGVQLEGWLKGELLFFLDTEKNAGRIESFDREIIVGQGRKKTDINIKLSPDSEIAWIELKHWLIGYQKGTPYNAQFYFGDPTSVGIKPDAEKLSGLSNGGKYLLILTTANPGLKDWSDGVEKFNRKFSPIQLKSLTNPTDFPNFYYLGLLEIISKPMK